MTSTEELSTNTVPELKELAAAHGVELAADDKKADIVEKVAAAITPEDLAASDDEDSPEQEAAARAGVPEETLESDVQNRAPKNEFEAENQKVTEAERIAAQEKSNMSTKDRIETSPAPAENAGADIAAAIRDGLKSAKDDNFRLQADEGVEPRFSLVKNASGEVLLRENATGTLSKIQLQSIEEKEASIQGQEVEEL